jgi:elongation factor Ts
MTITAKLIGDLRAATGAGMMDCKSALNETAGDFEAAVDYLRKKGIAKAGKKADRIAAEGLVAVASNGNSAAAVEINCETDFVAKNDSFQAACLKVAASALVAKGDEGSFKTSADTSSLELTATIGEKIAYRRSSYLEVANGVVASYIHNQAAPNLGKIAVLVALTSTGDKEKLNALGRKLAMHIAASKPVSLTRDGVDSSLLEREQQIFSDQARASGKPDNVIASMVEGRIRKFYEEIVLLDQAFVMDPKQKIAEVVKAAEAEVGAAIELTDYRFIAVGEGIEKKQEDFAAEVAKVASGN